MVSELKTNSVMLIKCRLFFPLLKSLINSLQKSMQKSVMIAEGQLNRQLLYSYKPKRSKNFKIFSRTICWRKNKLHFFDIAFFYSFFLNCLGYRPVFLSHWPLILIAFRRCFYVTPHVTSLIWIVLRFLKMGVTWILTPDGYFFSFLALYF